MADDIREVFISYHEKSAGEFVAELADKLESAGISCWYAKRDLPSGGDFADYIPPQISGCKVFLLILNEGANHSRHVESEVGLAFRRYNKSENITILPYQVEKCDFAHWLDYYLIHIQIQSTERMDMSALVTEVAHKLGRQPVKNGYCGPNTKWRLKDGVLTISKIENGKDAEIGNFYYQNVPDCTNTPWWNERKKITTVIIEHGITGTGRFAFRDCDNLISVAIPDSITEIGWATFSGCKSLTAISIPDSVTAIQTGAFFHCTSLQEINIPNSVTIIGDSSFSKCAHLANVTISNCIVSIKTYTFRGCTALTNVTIPDSVIHIQTGAFAGCVNLTSVSVPANAEIADDAFPQHTQVIRRPAR